MKTILVAGARPNFMKIAPLMAEFRRREIPGAILLHTGQHYDNSMSGEFFRELGIPAPDINLEVGSGSHAEQTARVMVAFEKVCISERPDMVVVVGDVNSTMACAITAKKLHIRVAHVEAGLRSGDMSMPEEINRLCTDAIADLLFTTDRIADENLKKEGVASERIRFVGNTMIDTLLVNLDRALDTPLPAAISPGQYAVLTLHRPGNVDDHSVLSGILDAIGTVAAQMPVVFPVHPRTARILEGMTIPPGIVLSPPLSYLPFIGLVARSRMVLTDSGGIQEETTVLKVPCITMRENTERPITCQIGTNVLVGTNPELIRSAALAAISNGHRQPSIPELWDGHAAERIIDILISSK